MSDAQTDIGRAIAGIVNGWTSVLSGASYSLLWNDVVRANDLGRARVMPGAVESLPDADGIGASAMFEGRFEVQIECVARVSPQATVTAVMRLARVSFRPESRAVQDGVAGLSDPNASGKILGRTVIISADPPQLTDAASLAGLDADARTPVIVLGINARWAENLT